MEHNIPSEQLRKDTTLLTWDATAVLERLTQVREQLNVSITQFAKACGLSYCQFYYLYEHQSLSTLKAEHLHNLCSTYSINLMWLLYGQQPVFTNYNFIWDIAAILQRLTHVRENLGLNITQFAKGCDLTYDYMHHLYTQRSLSALKAEHLHNLCSAYSINLMWLLYGQQPMFITDCMKKNVPALPLFFGSVNDTLDYAAIWERLAQFRKLYGISMKELSQVCGFSRTYLYRLFREDSLIELPMTALHNLYVTYGLNPLWLLYGMHSTHNDLLIALQNTDDSIRFDLFVRLYTYFTSHNPTVFNPSHEQGTSVPGATWDGTYFKPVAPTQTELAEGETAMTFL